MYRLIASLSDKLMFTVSCLLGMQIPAFINAYQQRLAGHLDEAHLQLQNFQSIADKYHQGDISQLLSAYRASADPGINASAELVLNLIDRIALLTSHLANLTQGDYVHQVYYFLTGMDSAIAKATLHDFQLALPMQASALATGLMLAIVSTFVFSQTLGKFSPQS
ncbi:DUF2937 family protein [Thalassotalea litorea]|uniref:DUF2937 family protein n=1 Tax=Thalassotalea litorea TaxID=2020715 RepID=A0A5R9ILE4_9GAMM|nr:DUF2937 family protein [Thalassotalea litorea]TLU66350.1 DUF2937 family protein [Thalassotalea litorea]